MIRSAVIAAVLSMTAPGLAFAQATPQAPIAAGPFDSIVEVLGAARDCGLMMLRIQVEPVGSAQPTLLFLAERPAHQVMACFDDWTTANGRRLELWPRWHGDTFETNPPRPARPSTP